MKCEVLTLDTFDRAWLESKAAALDGTPLLFVQGYEWIGFAMWKNGAFDLPPGAKFHWRFSEMWDVRLFAGSGEWHCWQTGEGIWRARFAGAEAWKVKEVRDYVLWGRESIANGTWATIREANGTCIDVPFPVGGDLKETPVRLRAWLAVDYDEATGQAYIADLMLRNLHQLTEG